MLQNGANVILPLMAASKTTMLVPPKHTAMVGSRVGLVSTTTGHLFDAASHFGCNKTLDRTVTRSKLTYSMCRHRAGAIQTTAACSGLPTPDSVIACDAHAPSVTLPKATFAALQLDGALFTRDAFWALPVEMDAEPDDSLMWSLVVQRLLWLSGNQIVVQRCGTGLIAKTSSRMLSAITSLNKWQCSISNMTKCILDLIAGNFGLLKDQTASSYSYWVDALAKTGYEFPRFSDPFNEACEKVLLHAVDHSVPVVPRHFGKVFSPVTNLNPIMKLYDKTCRHRNITLPNYIDVNFAQPWTQFDNILLIVIFNNPHYEAIPYIETLYRPFFPNMLYCGPNSIDTEHYPGINNLTFSFVSYGATPKGHVAGAFNYKCTAMALQLGYHVQGYLAVADDLLLLVHTLSDLTTNAVWFIPKKNIRIGEISRLRECRLGMCDFYPHWDWWRDYQTATTNALAEIANRRSSSAILQTCYQRLLSSNGAANRANGGPSDIYYIPSKLSQDFLELVDIFLRHNVFLEIAVPTIIRCLAPAIDVQPLLGEEMLDFKSRIQPWLYFKTKSLGGKSYFHPLKWGFLAQGSTEYTNLYCSKVLPYLHDHLARVID